MTDLNDLNGFEDLNITNECADESERYFAQVIGSIEEIIVDETFTELQKRFLETYWREFSTDEENKLIYMDIFQQYLATVEKFIEKHLLRYVTGFDMKTFEIELQKRKGELDGEIFEILSTFSDFSAFKNMVLDYKEMKEGRALDLSKEVSISKYCIRA